MQDDVKQHPDTPLLDGIALHPDTDGVTHLNLYTRAKTPLGRLGSNFADTPILHPIYGSFRSLEGLWYFLRFGMREDIFRVISGLDAKRQGKGRKSIWNPYFVKEFKLGILAKVEQHSDLRVMLANSTLPLVHYYYYGDYVKGFKVVKPEGHEWQMEFWEELRKRLHEHRSFDPIKRGLLASMGR